ncbi:hypothetical protein HPP92_020567 [Vanilla planifolia]|uniref:Uncharacterized protein n=1 Tax=Vanilla planifolia TaxID=51239 RepID=A0A835UK79_VANPL|nr:hypothetical protein HPP92_020567 [Vanilla planifolia]
MVDPSSSATKLATNNSISLVERAIPTSIPQSNTPLSASESASVFLIDTYSTFVGHPHPKYTPSKPNFDDPTIVSALTWTYSFIGKVPYNRALPDFEVLHVFDEEASQSSGIEYHNAIETGLGEMGEHLVTAMVSESEQWIEGGLPVDAESELGCNGGRGCQRRRLGLSTTIPHSIRCSDSDTVCVTAATSFNNFYKLYTYNPSAIARLHLLLLLLLEKAILSVLVTLFPNYGIAISTTLHYTAVEDSSCTNFMKKWAVISKLGGDTTPFSPRPYFDFALI